MYCPCCGFLLEEAISCPQCGFQIEEEALPWKNEDGLTRALSDTAFLLLTISFTLGIIFSFLSLFIQNQKMWYLSFCQIVPILFSFSLWLTFFKMRSHDAVAAASGLKFARGTLIAHYIYGWVVCSIFLFLAVAAFCCPVSLISNYFGTEIMNVIDIPGFSLSSIPWFLDVFKVVCGVVFLLAAILTIIINLCFTNKLLKFSKSLIDGLFHPDIKPVKARACSTWLLVLGIFMALSAFSSLFVQPFSGFTAGFEAVTMILASSVIKKHLCTPEE